MFCKLSNREISGRNPPKPEIASWDTICARLLEDDASRLWKLPTDSTELLPLLDSIGNILSSVEQSPSEIMQDAYSLCMDLLLEEPLLRHPNVDVRVAIASCFSEITRISAPELPCSDYRMKDVFQLIVSSFENLADQSSRSYGKRAQILEVVSKIKLCVLMLDLECNVLIVEMFRNFFNSIRDYHKENVFANMLDIMTLVLEESEDVSLELLTVILASVKICEEIPTIARKLGQKVLGRCAVKFKPRLIQAVKFLGVPLDEYSIPSSGVFEHNEADGSMEQMAGGVPTFGWWSNDFGGA